MKSRNESLDPNKDSLMNDAGRSTREPGNDVRELFVFGAGGQTFAVPADQVAGTAEGKAPARLPLAPAAILGVVSVRGRMLTTLDPLAFIKEKRSEFPTLLPLVVVLRGDEQLALAADCREDGFRVEADEIRSEPSTDSSTAGNSGETDSAILGYVYRDDRRIVVLDPGKLFASAMGKSERRRRRS